MNPKLTDDAVADLPLHRGRAELLEEIMSTPVIDDRPVPTERPRRRTAWAVPAVAAAAVLALVAGSAWLVNGPDGSDGSGGSDTTAVAGAPAAGEYRAVLDAPGWTVEGVYAETHFGELSYSNGDRSLEVTWYPAADYDDYVADRRRISSPPADGEPVEVLGLGGQLWAYSPQDHAVIREVDEGHWLELRGSGMGKAAYLELLGQLRLVDQAGFEAAMPEEFVDGGERQGSVGEILDGIGEHVDPLLPPGSDPARITSDQTDPYHLGAEIAGGVACEWLAEFEAGHRADDQQRMDAAAEALGTAREWPVLQEMTERGQYPMVLWSYADQVAEGELPEGYAGGLGCED